MCYLSLYTIYGLDTKTIGYCLGKIIVWDELIAYNSEQVTTR